MAVKRISKENCSNLFAIKIEIMTGSVGHGALLHLSYPGPQTENSTKPEMLNA